MLTSWNMTKNRKWAVVADWGAETTVTFHSNESAALSAYEAAKDQGANVVCARVLRARINEAK